MNWVSHYNENDPALRRVRTSPALYEQAAPTSVTLLTPSKPRGTGAFSSAVTCDKPAHSSSTLPRTLGFDLEYAQGPTRWATDAARQDPRIQERATDLGQGVDLAVLVGTAAKATDEVLSFLTDQQVAVSGLRTYTPEEGEHDSSVVGLVTLSASWARSGSECALR